MKFFRDLIFRISRPKIVFVAGDDKGEIKTAIGAVLTGHFKIGKEVLIYDITLNEAPKIKFFSENSSLPVLVINSNFAEKKDASCIKRFLETLPPNLRLVTNFDDEAIRLTLKEEAKISPVAFGFQDGADVQASDVAVNGKVNFKLNYDGSSVPFWIPGTPEEKDKRIYATLAAVACAILFGMNLVEISQTLKMHDEAPAE